MMYYPYYYNDIEQIIEFILGSISGISFVSLVMFAFNIVVHYLTLEKAGERGWESLIPFYSDYLEFKLYWNKNLYWLVLAAPIIIIILGIVAAFCYENIAVVATLVVVIIALLVALIVISIMLQVRKAKCFGQNGAFAIGLIFLNTIFIAILAFDKKCQYIRVDNQETIKEEPIQETPFEGQNIEQ